MNYRPVSPSKRQANELDLFFKASANGSITEIKRLLKKYDLDVNAKSKTFVGNTALIFAVRNDHMEVVQELIYSYGASIGEKGENTAFHWAAYDGRKEILDFLLTQFPEKIDWRNQRQETALFDAVLTNNFECVKLLVERGSDVFAKNISGEHPIDLAKKKEIITYLKEIMKIKEIEKKKRKDKDFFYLTDKEYEFFDETKNEYKQNIEEMNYQMNEIDKTEQIETFSRSETAHITNKSPILDIYKHFKPFNTGNYQEENEFAKFFEKREEFSDFILNKEIKCSKCFLRKSKFFRKLFKGTKDCSEYDFNQNIYSKQCVLLTLQYLYGIKPYFGKNVDSIFGTFRIAQFLNLKELEKYIFESISFDNVVLLIQKILKNEKNDEMNDFFFHCLLFFKKNYQKMIETIELESLGKDVLIEILKVSATSIEDFEELTSFYRDINSSPYSALKTHISRLYEERELHFNSILVSVDGKEFRVHKEILVSRSTKFKGLFQRFKKKLRIETKLSGKVLNFLIRNYYNQKFDLNYEETSEIAFLFQSYLINDRNTSILIDLIRHQMKEIQTLKKEVSSSKKEKNSQAKHEHKESE